MRQYYLLIPLLFSFSGCAPLQCGLEEKTFNQLSVRGKEEVCKEYNSKQIELNKIREQRLLQEEQNERERLSIEKQKVLNAYQNNYNEKVFIKINSGEANFYGRYEPIQPIGFEIIPGEVKRIPIYDMQNNASFLWVTYQAGMMYWNIQPEYNYENLSSYMDYEFLKYRGHDQFTGIIRNVNPYDYNRVKLNINGKYRGLNIRNMDIGINPNRMNQRYYNERPIIIINERDKKHFYNEEFRKKDIKPIEFREPKVEVIKK